MGKYIPKGSKSLKIFFIIKTLEGAKGGAERVLTDVAAALSKKGYEISVVSFDSKKSVPFYIQGNDVSQIKLDIGNVNKKSSVVEFFHRMLAIRRLVSIQKPDLVIAFMHSAFVPTAFALASTRIPVIASEHIVPEYYKRKKIEFYLFLLSSYFVKQITVLSENIKNEYPAQLQKKMIAIANPVSFLEKKSEHCLKKTRQKIILNIGRLTEQKDQQTLIKAFALLSDEFSEWKLRIIGEGELRPKLDRLISKLKLKNRITLAGATSNIEKEYERASIFALSSKYESFGLVTAEAMAFGLPTIGFSSCLGTNDLIIHEETGLQVNGEDRVHAFSEGLRRLMADQVERERMGASGMLQIQKFKPQKIIPLWESLITGELQ